MYGCTELHNASLQNCESVSDIQHGMFQQSIVRRTGRGARSIGGGVASVAAHLALGVSAILIAQAAPVKTPKFHEVGAHLHRAERARGDAGGADDLAGSG